MGKFELHGIDDFMEELSDLDIDRIAPVMLEEAVPILEKEVRQAAGRHKDSGAMAESIKATKVGTNSYGHYISVRPTAAALVPAGVDSKGVRNMEKMAYLEYGTSTQEATPVLSPAVRKAEEPVINKLQEVFDREVDKL